MVSQEEKKLFFGIFKIITKTNNIGNHYFQGKLYYVFGIRIRKTLKDFKVYGAGSHV